METVLVVDDEPTIREVVVQYLQREGYATLEAGDGDAARELLEREWPSLVVLDLMLPGIDGLALCRWIRDRSQLPVIDEPAKRSVRQFEREHASVDARELEEVVDERADRPGGGARISFTLPAAQRQAL